MVTLLGKKPQVVSFLDAKLVGLVAAEVFDRTRRG